MQTFLPYSDFKKSAKCLDYRRLGKQRVEAYQILNTLTINPKSRWRNHPAVKMWRGYEDALRLYINCMIFEWKSRGYKNNMKIYDVDNNISFPTWFGDEKFHKSHRSNLLRKYPEWYEKFGWVEPNDLPYFWPSEKK